jgi:hypothetical protein
VPKVPRRCDRDIIVQMTKIEIEGDPADGAHQADVLRIAVDAATSFVASVLPRVPNKPPGNRNLRLSRSWGTHVPDGRKQAADCHR